MSEIRHLISMEAPPEKVYAAVATSAGLVSWWTADSNADNTVGGNATFGSDNKSVIFRMTIEKLDPPALVIWRCHGDNPEWVGTTLSWEIEPADGGSRPSLHAKRVEIDDRDGRDLQLDLGRIDVPAQGPCRRPDSGPHWRE